MSSAGSDADISASKIDPLASPTKAGVEHDPIDGGVAGTDHEIDEARIDPLGGRGVGQHPEPHADDQGSVGLDANIEKAKLDPLASAAPAQSDQTNQASGLPDEQVDAARIAPMGEVRSE